MKQGKIAAVLSTLALTGFTFSNRNFTPPLAGTIAYCREGKEIRLIKPDGSNDHQLFTHPDANSSIGINDMAWRPDGKELAFSSGHEAVSSVYHADLYLIKPDGSGLRKLTNSPSRTEFSKYPQGAVSITVRNNQYTFQHAQSSTGIFLIYIAGAEKPEQIICGPGQSKTVVFKHVADFGKKGQAIVAMWGQYRWVMPGTDVQAGKSIKAPDLIISGDGIEYLGAYHPVWKNDASALSYRSGTCTVSMIPYNPPVGEYYYQPMFGEKMPFGACSWDWGPTPALADQVIYTENAGDHSSIYQLKEGGTHPGTWLTDYSDIQYQILSDLHWLPDGSGLLYSTIDLFREKSNIFRYDIRSKKTTQVTNFENEFARAFSISPDGAWIVYERAREFDDDKPADLWIQTIDGKNARLLVKNGRYPSWGRE
jgi:hypothetical protein